MDNALHRHDITDRAWEIIAPHLPGKPGDWGGIARDNRRFINAVMWILRTGAPWRDLPPDYGDWKNTHRRFCRWRDKGIWKKLFAVVVDDPDFEWLMIDATHTKAHRHAAGAEGGSEAIARTKGGLNTKVHLAVDAHGMPVRVLVTGGTTADCAMAPDLLHGFTADAVIADKGYDSHAIVDMVVRSGAEAVIPPRKGRKFPRMYDAFLYRLRHHVENAIQRLKEWRGVATRYAKRASSFLAIVQIRCAFQWLRIL